MAASGNDQGGRSSPLSTDRKQSTDDAGSPQRLPVFLLGLTLTDDDAYKKHGQKEIKQKKLEQFLWSVIGLFCRNQHD
jgi:hypothetical protein